MHGFNYSIPHFITRIRGTCIVVTPDFISEVLHVPRVEFADYPSCPYLRTVSKVELMSLFCETPSSWGEHQNTHCSVFAKGPRFLNMVMTFVLHPLSHYNSITKPRARFLLSLLEGLTIDFPSHFIFPLQMSIRIWRSVISLFSLLLSHGFFATHLSPILNLLISP